MATLRSFSNRGRTITVAHPGDFPNVRKASVTFSEEGLAKNVDDALAAALIAENPRSIESVKEAKPKPKAKAEPKEGR